VHLSFVSDSEYDVIYNENCIILFSEKNMKVFKHNQMFKSTSVYIMHETIVLDVFFHRLKLLIIIEHMY